MPWRFNRRYHRHGQLFQNRYKSIFCQEDAYLRELTRYIHLNPLRAGIVKDLYALETYPFAGHGVLMGNQQSDRKDDKTILGMFAKTKKTARKKYREFVKSGVVIGYSDPLITLDLKSSSFPGR